MSCDGCPFKNDDWYDANGRWVCENCFNKPLKNSKGESMDKDHINPDHYKKETSLECIESMELIFGKDAVYDFCVCNAWKYIWRWKNKNGVEDLKKAEWYVNRAQKYYGEPEYDRDMITRLHLYVANHGQEQEET